MLHVEIPKRGLTCSIGGERFLSGMEYYSLIFQEEESYQMKRQDFCLSCWNQHIKEEQIASSYGYWRSCIESKREELYSPKNQMERMMTLLRKLREEPQPDEMEIFVLVLSLARARQLFLRKEFEQQGSTYQLYEVAGQDEFLTIRKMELIPSLLESVQRSLTDKLKMI